MKLFFKGSYNYLSVIIIAQKEANIQPFAGFITISHINYWVFADDGNADRNLDKYRPGFETMP